MDWDFSNAPKEAADWIAELIHLDPIAPGPGPHLWERDDLVDLVSALLPYTETGLQCIALAEAIERGGKAHGEGGELVEELLALAYEHGRNESVADGWEVEWWYDAVDDLCPTIRAKLRILTRLGLREEDSTSFDNGRD